MAGSQVPLWDVSQVGVVAFILVIVDGPWLTRDVFERAKIDDADWAAIETDEPE